MGEAMVTGRMDEEKKRKGARVLAREGLNASQAINLLYDRIVEEDSASFLTKEGSCDDAAAWTSAARFVDGLSEERHTRFDDMTDAEIRVERLRSRGLI